MRLFAAVLPSPDAVGELKDAVAPLVERHDPDVRWTEPVGWHFTLAFMGEVGEAQLPELTERIGRAAGRTPGFPLRLHGAGHFGGRALWIGAAGGVEEIRLLASRVERAAHRTGIPMEEHRTYRPHLTVARSNGHGDFGPLLTALKSFESTSWQVRTVTLVRSRLPVSGVPGERPQYEALQTWPLTG